MLENLENTAMADKTGLLATANETLYQNIASLEQMVEIFSSVFELDIAAQAKDVICRLETIADTYFYETWDSSEIITSSLDLGFSELEHRARELDDSAKQLDGSINELKRIYEQSVLPQAVVMLVGSLEVYLSTVFVSCLSAKLDLSERAISSIRERYNFQNWGDSVDAFRTFLGIELCPQDVGGSKIVGLQQRRHVLVHRLGVIDERAARQLNSPSLVGKRLKIKQSEVMEGIKVVRRLAEHLTSTVET